MNVFQIIYGAAPPVVIECMNSVRRFYPDVVVNSFDAVDDPVRESDLLRYDILKKVDDALYIDWDIMLDSRLDIPENGLPCFGYFKDQPDYSIIYSPFSDWWRALDVERESRGISTGTRFFIRKLLREKRVNELSGHFEHYRGELKWRQMAGK